jgi:ribosomal protein S27E
LPVLALTKKKNGLSKAFCPVRCPGCVKIFIIMSGHQEEGRKPYCSFLLMFFGIQ